MSTHTAVDVLYERIEGWAGRDGRSGEELSYRDIRKKLRVACRGGFFLLLVVCALVYHTVNDVATRHSYVNNEFDHRSLSEGSSCPEPASPSALCLPYALGVAYLLLALAVVADEYFVPALELIGEHFELSEDVVGATLMAAGGSAPELFTNAAGTFARSDVGFGAIVGSAVFNLLFVIGIVAAIAPKPLQLTWYPITRDSICYVIILVSLAIFFGVTSPGVMELWESLILHFEYWLYVLFMRYSGRVRIYLDSSAVSNSAETGTSVVKDVIPSPLQPAIATTSTSSAAQADKPAPAARAAPIEQKSFRSGVMTMIIKNKTAAQLIEMQVVSRLVGTAQEVFDRADEDKSGTISFDELRVCLESMGVPDLTLDRIKEIFNSIDNDKNGSIDRDEFSRWFRNSRERVELEVEAVFDTFDTDKSGSVSKEELAQVMETLGSKLDAASLDENYKAMQAGSSGEVSRAQFSNWYRGSSFFLERQSSKVPAGEKTGAVDSDDEDDEEGLSIYPGNKQGWDLFYYVVFLPIALAFTFSIPDNKKDQFKGISWATLTFFICLAWMGVICYFLVEWITIIGATAKIPSVIMGLTFLAAGTSVPDMLGAMIVAKRGQGDQAVSSSVGSNVFDIGVGLALPWIAFYAVYQEAYAVTADSLFVSIIIIIVAVAFVLSVLKWQAWKHGKASGYAFCTGYLVFVAQQLGRTDWSGAC